MRNGIVEQRLRLSDFIFMMRKAQIHPAAVNVDLIAEFLMDHNDAFRMPARPAFAPRRLPFNAHIRFFPQSEVQRIFLFCVFLDPRPDLQVFQILLGKASVGRHAADAEIHVAADLIGMAGLDQFVDEMDDFIHGFRYPRSREQWFCVQTIPDFLIGFDIAGGHDAFRYVFLMRFLNDLIVDVRVVGHVFNRVTLRFK